ncbi:MAG: efflux RND transporter periplasmic adaptor subunit [Arenicellales bacterium]
MPRHSKTILISLIVLLLLGVTMLQFIGTDSAESPALNLGKIKLGSLKSEVSATGTLSPVITVQVGSQVSGTIQHLYADFNSEVKKGEIIAQIDSAIFKAKLAEAEADVLSSKAARDKAQVQVKQSKNTLDRTTGLFKKKLVSDSELDEARYNHQEAIAEHRVKEAAVVQAEAVRQREQVNLAYSSIYAPIDGVVISRDVDVGQTVAASLQAPTLFTIARDLAQMQIETDVDEAFIGKIEEQQPVTFTVFAYPERMFKGRVSQVRLQPKVEAGVVKYNCIIQVDNTDLALKPGMTATVAIEVENKDSVFKVPNAALRFVPDWPAERLKKIRSKLNSSEAILWLPDGEDMTTLKVSTGIVGEKETEVIGDGLQQDMAIVLPPKRVEAKRKRRFGLSLF